tara:strand:- start:220 stop:768 length:549 start_codon:yes stop_codon:yes gene_type:complete
MRHRIAGRKLNRKTSHRISMLRNMSRSLIRNEQIETTLPKAKDLRPFVEKILTKGKKDDLSSRRRVFTYLRDNVLVEKVFSTLAKRYVNRNGGYVRILKSGFRYGDSAPMAIIELVDRDSNAKGLIDKIRKEKKENEVDSSKSNKIENEIPEKKNLVSKIKEEISEDSKTKDDSKKKEVDKS